MYTLPARHGDEVVIVTVDLDNPEHGDAVLTLTTQEPVLSVTVSLDRDEVRGLVQALGW